MAEMSKVLLTVLLLLAHFLGAGAVEHAAEGHLIPQYDDAAAATSHSHHSAASASASTTASTSASDGHSCLSTSCPMQPVADAWVGFSGSVKEPWSPSAVVPETDSKPTWRFCQPVEWSPVEAAALPPDLKKLRISRT
ncbi:hypothetical protein HD598_001336 [Neomicrococcus aestuarii]|uniref:Uncharacterized protein n=1 Tax=Neomicrococcus aestuarii TaxID=556325 RepID=A0A7W8TTJ3_9MICC|nr:hypothetical protein [Neomicrococcus aestuarii]